MPTTTSVSSNDGATVRPPGARVEVRGLRRAYPGPVVAVDDASLTIEPGELVALTGPSGSGKTTLLSILGLLDTPTGGEYAIGGEKVAGLAPRDRALLRNRHIGFVFQSFNLIGDLTVAENVGLPLTYRGLPEGERKRRVEAALERVGMSHRARHLTPSSRPLGPGRGIELARGRFGVLWLDTALDRGDSRGRAPGSHPFLRPPVDSLWVTRDVKVFTVAGGKIFWPFQLGSDRA